MNTDEIDLLTEGLDLIGFALTDNLQGEYTILEACLRAIKFGDFSELNTLLTRENSGE